MLRGVVGMVVNVRLRVADIGIWRREGRIVGSG